MSFWLHRARIDFRYKGEDFESYEEDFAIQAGTRLTIKAKLQRAHRKVTTFVVLLPVSASRSASVSDNPYQSPLSSAEPVQAVGVLSGRREDVRAVAIYQRGILVCILLYLAAVVGQFVFPPELRLLIAWL